MWYSGTCFSSGLVSVLFIVRLNDLKSLFQLKRFYKFYLFLECKVLLCAFEALAFWMSSCYLLHLLVLEAQFRGAVVVRKMFLFI